MRKDYITVGQSDDQETEFVEKHWTSIWEKEGGPQGKIEGIPRKVEYRVMAPYLQKLPKSARIIDGGCGLGDWTLYLTQLGFSVVGVDLSRHTVEQLKMRFPEAMFVDGDIRNTGFKDSEFDAYFSWGVFEHFEEGQHRCIAEALRILKPGGLLFVTVPFDNWRQGLIAGMDGLRRAPPVREPMRFYQWRLNRRELRTELSRGGFEVLDLVPIHAYQGVLRMLHHQLGFSYDWKLTRYLAYALSLVVPRSFFAHMLMAVARKPLD